MKEGERGEEKSSGWFWNGRKRANSVGREEELVGLGSEGARELDGAGGVRDKGYWEIGGGEMYRIISSCIVALSRAWFCER